MLTSDEWSRLCTFYQIILRSTVVLLTGGRVYCDTRRVRLTYGYLLRSQFHIENSNVIYRNVPDGADDARIHLDFKDLTTLSSNASQY